MIAGAWANCPGSPLVRPSVCLAHVGCSGQAEKKQGQADVAFGRSLFDAEEIPVLGEGPRRLTQAISYGGNVERVPRQSLGIKHTPEW